MRSLGWLVESESKEERRRVHAITKQGTVLLEAELARLDRLLAQARPALARGR